MKQLCMDSNLHIIVLVNNALILFPSSIFCIDLVTFIKGFLLCMIQRKI